MRLIFTSLIFLLSFFSGKTQNLTGIWRGHFIQKDFDLIKGRPTEDRYKYEIQINNLANNGIEGVTYSYKTTVFYGKAALQGIYTKKTKNLIVKEVKMLELKVTNNTAPCLMTCYLDYSETNGKETLTGTYTSISEKNTDCGSGTVFLEKVTTTEFEKEPFLLKKKEPSATTKKSTEVASANGKKGLSGNLPTTPKTTTKVELKNGTQSGLPKIKPGAEGFVIAKNDTLKATQKSVTVDTVVKPSVVAPIIPQNKKIEPAAKVPKVLLERENNLQKTLIVDQQEVRIDYYDNGQVDNDTITVYHNNQVLINRGRLDTKPLTLMVHLDEQNPKYELITVAENLGDTPPNTALMVITAGKKRYEVNITSDDKKNAKVILEYQAPPKK
ncbi:hypothetical protein ACFOW1_12460 [Parasediminibacterium paludis]|uniref:Uncharacterized protein n=1 Tax=Parasediminibacterium paludis TaxID=908966 RepID=A0ABV8PXL7_9BACT